MVRWEDGRVVTRDSVEIARQLSGDELRKAYARELQAITFGLVSMRGNSIMAGPLELLRFGRPRVAKAEVDWPIEGGLLARTGGGRWLIRSEGGRVTATVEGYVPRLPRWLYAVSHLRVHLLFTRLFLLRLRGRDPAPGVPAARQDRIRAAAVDVAFCITLAGIFGRRRKLGTLVAFMAGYHVACWSTSGRTLGGLVVRQRVVAVDGTRLTAAQSLLRLALLPLSWITREPVHDDIACTEVIAS